MRNSKTSLTLLVLSLWIILFGRDAKASTIVFDSLNASLNTGSLAGTTFSVSFSFDASQINPAGPSFILLNSFDFTLLGTSFDRSYIFQGGQALLQDGVLNNVTASYQVLLPPGAPVQNITFGFGGPGAIGYLDLNGSFGDGRFTFAQSATGVPEPGTGAILLVVCVAGAILRFRRYAGFASTAPQFRPAPNAASTIGRSTFPTA